MAVTKILPRNGGLKEAIDYVLNGDKTDGHILTAHFNCDPGREYREMMKTKLETGRLDKRQCYHIIQSFKPGEITPELALEIAKAFAQEHLDGFEVVIGTHVDRHHIHSHIVFNSVNADTGEKYHSTQQSYYQQIRAISDRLCREHGLSVIVQGAPARSFSYIEWLRQSKGQPTFRSMLEADLRDAIRDANDLGHFFLLMEHKGYEIHHGGRLGFRLRGQERFQYPGRRDPLFTEDGIRAAIQGNLEQIEAGLRPVLPARPAYQPYRKHPRYSGFLALYVHYLYLLGKIEKRQYPPRMTPHLRQAVMRFEQYQAQFAFLRENDITTLADMAAFEQRTEETLGRLTKQRTLLNVRKKKRQPLYAALADAEALEPSRALYEEGLTGMEQEFEQYMKAVKLLEDTRQKSAPAKEKIHQKARPDRTKYADRVFTTAVVSYPELTHIGEDKDFTPVIEKALELGGYNEDKPFTGINGGGTVMTGFGHGAVLGVADQVIEAVKSGAIRHFFLVGGCDGARPGRNYYTEFVKQTPADTVVLTLACGKYRFNDLDLGTIGGLPRLMDVGQCNDAYGAVKIALALAEAFGCGVNDLPLSMVLSWYEQKAVCILLTLLHLGIKNIRLGPTLPAFVSPNVLNYLVENFGIAPITTPEEDLKQLLK